MNERNVTPSSSTVGEFVQGCDGEKPSGFDATLSEPETEVLGWYPHQRDSLVLILFLLSHPSLFQNYNGCLHIPNNGHSYREVPGSMQASSLS